MSAQEAGYQVEVEKTDEAILISRTDGKPVTADDLVNIYQAAPKGESS